MERRGIKRDLLLGPEGRDFHVGFNIGDVFFPKLHLQIDNFSNIIFLGRIFGFNPKLLLDHDPLGYVGCAQKKVSGRVENRMVFYNPGKQGGK